MKKTVWDLLQNNPGVRIQMKQDLSCVDHLWVRIIREILCLKFPKWSIDKNWTKETKSTDQPYIMFKMRPKPIYRVRGQDGGPQRLGTVTRSGVRGAWGAYSLLPDVDRKHMGARPEDSLGSRFTIRASFCMVPDFGFEKLMKISILAIGSGPSPACF